MDLVHSQNYSGTSTSFNMSDVIHSTFMFADAFVLQCSRGAFIPCSFLRKIVSLV